MPDSPQNMIQAAEWLREAGNIVVFSGAGISAESGIPTFRDEDGVWSKYPPEQFAHWQGLLHSSQTQPRRVVEFVLGLIEPIIAASPNPGHVAIADLERHAEVTVITQNIDGLHQQAGSTRVHEVHGSLFEIVTAGGQAVRTLTREDLADIADMLRSAISGDREMSDLLADLQPVLGDSFLAHHRTKVVLFGDPMCEPDWSNACEAATRCDCMITVGTSCQVYPAAALPDNARAHGAKVIAVDPENSIGDVWLRGKAGALLPRLMEAAFG